MIRTGPLASCHSGGRERENWSAGYALLYNCCVVGTVGTQLKLTFSNKDEPYQREHAMKQIIDLDGPFQTHQIHFRGRISAARCHTKTKKPKPKRTAHILTMATTASTPYSQSGSPEVTQ